MTKRVTLSAAVLLALGAAVPASAGPRTEPGARVELAKVAPVRGRADDRLVVKFRDVVRARATPAGLVSRAGVDLSALAAGAAAEGAAFEPLIRVPEARLGAVEARALARSGVAQPDLAGMFVVRAPGDRLDAIAGLLHGSPLTEWVAFEATAPEPPSECTDIPPATPGYQGNQGYRGPDPGLNMEAAWALGDMRGAGVRLADCEYGVVFGHEDLCAITTESGQTIHPNVISNGWDEHGTAVFGELASGDNGFGCVGLAPDVEAYFFTEWSVEEGFRRVTAITRAIETMDAGDVVLLEMQTTGSGGGYGPAELDRSVWTVVKVGTDAGVIVVGAAGNGNQDLDSAPYSEYRSRGDSGAILVGAGTSSTRHDKLSFSTYGARVNVQGWGQNVFTTGYGSFAQHGGDRNQRYTATFNGTSSASPFVAASAAALQGFAEARLGRRLSPLEMRALLVETGVPQGSGGHIGPFPDVYGAAQAILASCRGDFNGDGDVNSDDFFDFFNAYLASDRRADVNGDGVVDSDDFFDFLNALYAGC